MSKLSGIKVCQNCGAKFVPRTTWQENCNKECFYLSKAKKEREAKKMKSELNDNKNFS